VPEGVNGSPTLRNVHRSTPPLIGEQIRPPVPMAPKVLMVSRPRVRPRRRRRLGNRGAARPLMAAALTPLRKSEQFPPLQVAEKPSIALSIASALSGGRVSAPPSSATESVLILVVGVGFGRDLTSDSFGNVWSSTNGRRADGCWSF
jgi:hypothetical protein